MTNTHTHVRNISKNTGETIYISCRVAALGTDTRCGLLLHVQRLRSHELMALYKSVCVFSLITSTISRDEANDFLCAGHNGDSYKNGRISIGAVRQFLHGSAARSTHGLASTTPRRPRRRCNNSPQLYYACEMYAVRAWTAVNAVASIQPCCSSSFRPTMSVCIAVECI